MIDVFHAADWLANVFFSKLGQSFVIATTLVNLQTSQVHEMHFKKLVDREHEGVITAIIRYGPRETGDHLHKKRSKKEAFVTRQSMPNVISPIVAYRK